MSKNLYSQIKAAGLRVDFCRRKEAKAAVYASVHKAFADAAAAKIHRKYVALICEYRF